MPSINWPAFDMRHISKFKINAEFSTVTLKINPEALSISAAHLKYTYRTQQAVNVNQLANCSARFSNNQSGSHR